MTFIKYTSDGKAVIQPAALILSGLEKEDVLEMHTLDNLLVLIKEEMSPVEKVKTVCSLMRLVSSLTADLLCEFDESIDDEADDDCGDMFPIPVEALEDAGIWGKDLSIQVVDGAVTITADEEANDSCDDTEQVVRKLLFDTAVTLNMVIDLLSSGDADD